jgi:hypothetical protein
LRQFRPGPGDHHNKNDTERDPKRGPQDHQTISLHISDFASDRLAVEFQEGAKGEYKNRDREVGPRQLRQEWNAEADNNAGDDDSSAILSCPS